MRFKIQRWFDDTEEFIRYAFDERVEGIRRILDGGFGPEALIGFTRHNAAVITCGKAGPNGSIKGIGFIHKEEFLRKPLKSSGKSLRNPLT